MSGEEKVVPPNQRIRQAAEPRGAVDPTVTAEELEERIRMLEGDNQKLEARADELESLVEKADEVLTELQQKNERLRNALVTYGKHGVECPVHRAEGLSCTCGLEEAYRAGL